MGNRLRSVRAADGRALAVAQWGDPEGGVVFSLHGTPGSRLARLPDEQAVADAGIRVITYDRPGYGASDRHRGRRVVDCVADVRAIADDLGIERFAVTGGSGGGPHALAVAACLADRVTRAECVVGVAPPDAAGLEWLEGMDPENVREFGWAQEGEDVLHRELDRLAAEDLQRIADDPSKLLSDDWELAEADRRMLARTDIQTVMTEMYREAVRSGTWGWVDDDLAFLAPWGFSVEDIAVPVLVRYGVKDVLVPAAHGAWLAAHVPQAEVAVDEESGHLADPDRRLIQLKALVC